MPLDIHVFEKRVIRIRAVRLTVENITNVERWCGGQIKGTQLPVEQRCIDIQTREGEMRADIGDWVIEEPFPTSDRSFYPCKPDIFEKSYSAVN